MKKVKKRDGSIVDFDKARIDLAIWKAAQSVGGNDHGLAVKLGTDVDRLLDELYGEKKIPSVEDVQDLVERVLIESGHSQTAKAFIIYRRKRQELRESKLALGVEDDMKLSFDALRILVQYHLLQKTSEGKLETPRQMFMRVAHALAAADKKYGDEPGTAEKEFADSFLNLDTIPGLAMLRFAGTEVPLLSEAFALPLQDDISALFTTLRDAALLHKSRPRGFGLGFSFSSVRSRGSKVAHGENASGPVSFLLLYDKALHQINPYGVNMAFLNIHHPDIIDFITSKESSRLTSFGISVLLTKEFMRAVEEDELYKLIDPRTGNAVTQVRAQSVLDMIATIAWQTGDPAVVFLDNLNDAPANPFEDEQLEATAPTGEHPLFPYEGYFSASVNLANHITGSDLDWEKLKKTVHSAVHLLDNAIDVCSYPLPQMKDAAERTRRIGLSIMGWADALIWLQLSYNSQESLKLAEKLMKFVASEAEGASMALAKKRGTFEGYKKSAYAKRNDKVRNAARTTISPCGIQSIIAGCSQGIEPHYAISYVKRTPTAESFEVIPIFEDVARKDNFYSPELMKKIALAGSVHDVKEIPEKWRTVFITAHDCSAEDHLSMQAAFQKHTDNCVSKTINMPSTATITEVELVFKKAYGLGCKSVHIYREGSSQMQLIHSRARERRQRKKRGV